MPNFEQIIEDLSALSIQESITLVATLENRWGVESAYVKPMELPTLEHVEVQKASFDVVVVEVPPGRRIKVIKTLRVITGKGLRESKNLLDALPFTLASDLSETDAETLKNRLVEAGAIVELR